MKNLRCWIFVIVFFSFSRVYSAVEIDDRSSQLVIHVRFEHNERKYYLRSTLPEDLDHYRKIFGNEECMSKYMDGNPRPDEEIVERHKRYLGLWQRKDPWSSYLVFNDEDQFVGHFLLEPNERGNPREVELSYVLCREFWKQGICSVSIRELMEQLVVPVLLERYPYEDQRICQVFSRIRPDNPASRRVLEKNDFEPENDGVIQETSYGSRVFYLRRL